MRVKTLGKTIWDKAQVLFGTSCRTNLGTHWEPFENLMGTHWEQGGDFGDTVRLSRNNPG